jgi:hypothetical protein
VQRPDAGDGLRISPGPVEQNRRQASRPRGYHIQLMVITDHQNPSRRHPEAATCHQVGPPIRLASRQLGRSEDRPAQAKQPGRGEFSGLLGVIAIGQHRYPQPGRSNPPQRRSSVLESDPGRLVTHEILGENPVKLTGRYQLADSGHEIPDPTAALVLKANLTRPPRPVMPLLEIKPERGKGLDGIRAETIRRKPGTQCRRDGPSVINQRPVQVKQHGIEFPTHRSRLGREQERSPADRPEVNAHITGGHR